MDVLTAVIHIISLELDGRMDLLNIKNHLDRVYIIRGTPNRPNIQRQQPLIEARPRQARHTAVDEEGGLGTSLDIQAMGKFIFPSFSISLTCDPI